MKKLCAVFALLLLLLLPFSGSASDGKGESGVKVVKSSGEVRTDSIEKSENFSKTSQEEQEEVKTEEGNEAPKKEDEGKTLKAIRAAFTGALNDFVYGIINQLMEGSVTVFEAEVETDENGESETVSYTINSKPVDPYAQPFVRKVQLPTGGFYFIGVFFTILGSYLMRLLYEKYPVQFSEFREKLTGEEKPYNNDTIVTASVIAMILWIVYIVWIFGVTGIRNLIVATVDTTEVVLPATYADSIPTFLLTGLASYSSAFQSNTGLYGIYTFTAILFVAGMLSELLLILGATGAFWKFNIIFCGMFALFNIIDIVNACSVSAGVSIYLDTGNPIFITIGLVVSCSAIIVLSIMITAYAIRRGRKVAIGW